MAAQLHHVNHLSLIRLIYLMLKCSCLLFYQCTPASTRQETAPTTCLMEDTNVESSALVRFYPYVAVEDLVQTAVCSLKLPQITPAILALRSEPHRPASSAHR
jgi:hypothetical protein